MNYIIDGFPDDYVNAKGIPRAEFLEDPAKYLKDNSLTPEEAKMKMQEQLGKYKMMLENITYKRMDTKARIPEVERTIEAVELLKNKKEEEEIKTHFALGDNIYAEAKIKNQNIVVLYLGAGVYVEHTYVEAISVLQKTLNSSIEKEKQFSIDVAWLQDQITTSEVNWSRLHNYGFYMKQQEGGKKK